MSNAKVYKRTYKTFQLSSHRFEMILLNETEVFPIEKRSYSQRIYCTMKYYFPQCKY